MKQVFRFELGPLRVAHTSTGTPLSAPMSTQPAADHISAFDLRIQSIWAQGALTLV